MSPELTIIETSDRDALYSWDAQNGKPHPCHIALDLETGEMWAAFSEGNFDPYRVFRGLLRRYPINGVLQGETANELMREIAPWARIVLQGSTITPTYAHDANWRLNGDATVAERQINEACAEVEPDFYWTTAEDFIAVEGRQSFVALLSRSWDPWSVEQVAAYFQGDGRLEDEPRIEGLAVAVQNIAAELAAEVSR